MKRSRWIMLVIALLLAGSVAVNMVGCAARVQADDLMEGIHPAKITLPPADDRFFPSQMEFSLNLFERVFEQNDGQNVLISPLSVNLALAMTANGAAGDTQSQMEQVIGAGASIDSWNEFLLAYQTSLSSGEKHRLSIANSIWIRDEQDRLNVERDFLQKNADYYGAAAYRSAFDGQTIQDINRWVKDKTDGRIEKILNDIRPETILYLVNALAFEAEWQTVYSKEDISDGSFTNGDGSQQTVSMMSSTESYYLDDGKATGFIKPYCGGQYSFVALLPQKGLSLSDYVDYLQEQTAETMLDRIINPESAAVQVKLPKFSYDFSTNMNEPLKALGMEAAFDESLADFSRLGRSSAGNIFIGNVIHGTHIAVDELGTKAGAVTLVEMNDTAALVDPAMKKVVLDRPFLYLIVDQVSGLPLFLGAVTDLSK